VGIVTLLSGLLRFLTEGCTDMDFEDWLEELSNNNDDREDDWDE
jgi:hypothetical protein